MKNYSARDLAWDEPFEILTTWIPSVRASYPIKWAYTFKPVTTPWVTWNKFVREFTYDPVRKLSYYVTTLKELGLPEVAQRVNYKIEMVDTESGGIYETYTGYYNVSAGTPSGNSEIQGRVRDVATLEPIAAATVDAEGRKATTDGLGNFSITGLGAKTWHVCAVADHYQQSCVDLELGENEVLNFVFNLQKEIPPPPPDKGQIFGTVSDLDTGAPIAGAEIDFNTFSTHSLDNGNYSSGNVNPGAYMVSAGKEGYEPQTVSITVVAGQATQQNFRLKVSVAPPPPPTLDCEHPPVVSLFFQPIVNVIWWLFCPLVKGFYDLGKVITDTLKAWYDFLTNPAAYTAKAITDGFAGKSPSVIQALTQTVGKGAIETVGVFPTSVNDVVVLAMKNMALPYLLEARSATLADLQDTSLSPQEVVNRSLERLIEVEARVIWKSWLMELCTAGQVRALEAYFGNIVSMLGFNDLHSKILSHMIDTRVDIPLTRSMNEAFRPFIPPPADLVRMKHRRKIDETEMKALSAKAGLSDEWTEKYDKMALQIPRFEDFRLAWLRGKIDDEQFADAMNLLDFDPEHKTVFDTRKYDDPGEGMTRLMFEGGEITDEQVKTLVHLQGYTPEMEKLVGEVLIGAQAKLWRRRYLMQTTRAYSKDKITADELKANVKAAKWTDETADWMIKTGDLMREIAEKEPKEKAPRLESLAMVIDMWAYEIIEEPEVVEEIAALRYPEEKRPKVLEYCRNRMLAKQAKLAKQAAKAG
jgi:hypothetical protein